MFDSVAGVAEAGTAKEKRRMKTKSCNEVAKLRGYDISDLMPSFLKCCLIITYIKQK